MKTAKSRRRKEEDARCRCPEKPNSHKHKTRPQTLRAKSHRKGRRKLLEGQHARRQLKKKVLSRGFLDNQSKELLPVRFGCLESAVITR